MFELITAIIGGAMLLAIPVFIIGLQIRFRIEGEREMREFRRRVAAEMRMAGEDDREIL